MPPVGFEPTISAGERPKTYGLDRAATGTGKIQRLSALFNDAVSCYGYMETLTDESVWASVGWYWQGGNDFTGK